MRTKNFELDNMLKTVRRIGVMFKMRGVSGIYWAPQLAHHYRCRVRVGFNPDAIKKGGLNSVLIFSSDTGEYICEAWLMGLVDSKYGIEDVRRKRRNFL